MRRPGEHAVKMDNDVVIHYPGWADVIEEVFERDPTIGICALKRRDLGESPWAEGDAQTVLEMLPHKPRQRWLAVEIARSIIGTCEAFNSLLLDKIGYLVQPGVYGFDDALASVRCRLAGFRQAYLCGVDIDHVDPGGDAYCAMKRKMAGDALSAFNTAVLLYESGGMPLYHGWEGDDETTFSFSC